MYRLIALFLIVLCLLPAPLVAAADPGPNTILIYAEINVSGQGENDFPPGRSNFSLAFYATLRDLLRNEGFDPVFVAGSVDDHYPDFFHPRSDYEDDPAFWKHVLFVSSTSYGEEDWVSLTQFAFFQFPGLPTGTFGFTLVPRISVERFESLQEVARLTAGVALYTSRHCDAALPYLVEASTNRALMNDGLLLYGGTMFYRASCEYDQGLLEEAAESYQAVIDFPYDSGDNDPLIFSDDAAINLAWIEAELGRQDEGVALLDRYGTIHLDTVYQRDMERFLKRADAYLALGANDSAIAEVTTLIGIAERDAREFPPTVMARLYTERGQRHLQVDQTAQALADFERAIQLDDQYPKVYYARGMQRFASEEYSLAQADFERFISLAPTSDQYYEDDLTPYIEQASDYLATMAENATPTPKP